MIDNTSDEDCELSKKERILLTASNLFLQKDFKTVSTQDIAKAAGVAKGTVFHHFANKYLLALTVLENYLDQYSSKFEQMKEIMEPEELVVEIIHYSLDLVENTAGLTPLFLQIVADLDQQFRDPQAENEKEIQEKVRKIESQMVQYIEEFAIIFENMGFDNPHAKSRIFIAALDGLVLQLSLNPKPDKKTMEQLTKSLIALFTHR